MENKVFKKLAAMGAALMMAVTGMSMNVSATTTTSTRNWMVRRVIVNGYVSGESVSTSSTLFTPGDNRTVTTVATACNSYSSGTTGNGLSLGADCWVSKCDAAGNHKNYLGYYHYTSTTSHNFTANIEGPLTVKVEYSIDHPYTINCYISGTTTGTYVS